MTDPRRQIAAAILHGPSIPPLGLQFVYLLVTRPPYSIVVDIVARWLGIIPGDYCTSEDPGKPQPRETLNKNTPEQ
jgi:hypothetical protein